MDKEYTATGTISPFVYMLGKAASILSLIAAVIWFGVVVFSPKAQAEGLVSVLNMQSLGFGIFVLMIGIFGWISINRYKQK